MEDHMLVAHTLAQLGHEYQRPFWVAILDFSKAFDSIDHDAILRALKQQGVEDAYIHILQQIYSNQLALVKADAESFRFPILRGTKQGDPIPPILFNATVEGAMRECVS